MTDLVSLPIPAPRVAPEPEPYRYPAADLVAAARSAFGVNSEVMRAALFCAQLTAATTDEARAAIDAFLTKEV